jgi:hypothetical protein
MLILFGLGFQIILDACNLSDRSDGNPIDDQKKYAGQVLVFEIMLMCIRSKDNADDM